MYFVMGSGEHPILRIGVWGWAPANSLEWYEHNARQTPFEVWISYRFNSLNTKQAFRKCEYICLYVPWPFVPSVSPSMHIFTRVVFILLSLYFNNVHMHESFSFSVLPMNQSSTVQWTASAVAAYVDKVFVLAPFTSQNISSVTRHIESLDAYMEH
jgi:hypothetical protein